LHGVRQDASGTTAKHLLTVVLAFRFVHMEPYVMMRSLLTVLSLLALTTTAQMAQKAKPAKPSPSTGRGNTVLATVGKEPVLYADVERAFQKNMNRRDTRLTDVPRDTMLDFLRLYTNYRLKVLDARRRGFDKDSAVLRDIASNRKLLSETFLFDKLIADARVDELVRRRQQELELGIILCAVSDPETNTVDSARSFNKALAVIELLNKGASFERVARDSSDDRETANRGGRLPWITGGSVIKMVEDEAYSLAVGSHSKRPVGSRHGYFIVRIFRAEPRQAIKVRHILLSTTGERDSAANEAFADEVLSLVRMRPEQAKAELAKRGIKATNDIFADLALAYSDDKSSGAKGGALGTYYTRSGGLETTNARLAKEFEDGMFALRDGEVSGKVRSMFGIHIIRRDSTRKQDPMADRDNAKKTYRRLYFEEDKRTVIDSLKRSWGYAWNAPALERLLAAIDTTKNTNDTTWVENIPSDLLAQPLYRAGAGSLTVRQFTDSLRRRVDMRGYTLNRSGLERAANKIIDPLVIDRATSDLEKAHADFRSLMQEFSDGILLFKVEEQEVWSKIGFDSVEARKYYDSTSTRWKTEQRYTYTEVYVSSDSLANELLSKINSGADIASVAEQHTERGGMREKRGQVVDAEPRRNKIADKLKTEAVSEGSIIGPFSHERGYSIVRLDGIKPPRQKTFEEASGDLAPSFQDMTQRRLQEAWLSRVRTVFPVVVNNANVNALYK
jgi:peptidyl-prolyl cis-trans isomerase SurA